MKKAIVAITCLLFFSLNFTTNAHAHFSENYYETKTTLEEAPNAFSHAIFDKLLKKYVNATGNVNYAGFKRDKAKLKNYLNLLQKANPNKLSRKEQIAFWINAYNAHTIYLVIQKYPITSILKINGGKVWTTKKLNIGGRKSITLSKIEKTILIGKYKEPRIHFAINCAAKSCPPLMNKAWTGARLNADLKKMTQKFINNKKFNSISSKKANLSKIFEWYKKDFGNVATFINKYSASKISRNTKITYAEYNWNLNK